MPLDFRLSHAELAQVRAGALVVVEDAPVFRVEGPGALDCLQGLLTCDLVAPGEASLCYGAILTPKGMIVADPWVLRERDGVLLRLPPGSGPVISRHLARVLPPRLARVTDLSSTWGSAWLLGDRARETADAAGLPAPPAGRLGHSATFPELWIGTGPAGAPFGVLLLGPRASLTAAIEAYVQAGGSLAGDAALAAARVLAGWPTLGREIDERTLPQEVRYDEIPEAVSYRKGCFTGQETVARVHFRGQVNRLLRGITLDGGAPADRVLTDAAGPRGTLRTALLLDDSLLALASVRREIEPGTELMLGTRPARVLALPFPALAAG